MLAASMICKWKIYSLSGRYELLELIMTEKKSVYLSKKKKIRPTDPWKMFHVSGNKTLFLCGLSRKSHVENMWCLHIFVAERHPHSCNIIWTSNVFTKELEDIKWYCKCPSAFLQQIYVNKTRFQCAILYLCNKTVILTKLVFKFKDL